MSSAVNIHLAQLLLYSLELCSGSTASTENVVVIQHSSKVVYSGINILAHLLQLSQ